MFNTENDATLPQFAVGLTGYYCDQLNALGGANGGFQSDGVGIGPALLFTPKLFGRDVNLIAK